MEAVALSHNDLGNVRQGATVMLARSVVPGLVILITLLVRVPDRVSMDGEPEKRAQGVLQCSHASPGASSRLEFATSVVSPGENT